MDSTPVKIALLQLQIQHDPTAHLEKVENMIKTAVDHDASIICLPELFATRYIAQKQDQDNSKSAQPIPGPLSEKLQFWAKKFSTTLIGGSIFEVDANHKQYNTSLVIDDTGSIRVKYRKMHIPHDPHYWEQHYFQPGDLGYNSAQIKNIHLAPLICYDQWFPEPARILTLQGTQLITYPTAIGWTEQMRREEPWSAERWVDAIRAHASLNGIFIAAINRVGLEDEIEFWGNSFVADPFGQIIAKASADREEILYADLDLSLIPLSQDGWGFLRNRRPESYQDLLKPTKKEK
jgi:N-carbamoylputrescine amidase